MNGFSAARRPRRIWPWVLAAMGVLLLATLLGGLWAVLSLADAARDSVHVVLNGQPWDGWRDWDLWNDWDSWQHTVLHPDAWNLSLAAVALLLLAVLVLVPLAVLLVLAGVALALAVALAAAVVSVAAALSPLLLLALLLWLLLREKPARTFQAEAPNGAARMQP